MGNVKDVISTKGDDQSVDFTGQFGSSLGAERGLGDKTGAREKESGMPSDFELSLKYVH